MATELKEVVMNADAVALQDLSPDVHEHFLDWRARSNTVVLLLLWAGLKRSQGLAVELAVGSEGQSRKLQQQGRDHVVGQGAAQMLLQLQQGIRGLGLTPD
jgi:hypothetical protein